MRQEREDERVQRVEDACPLSRSGEDGLHKAEHADRDGQPEIAEGLPGDEAGDAVLSEEVIGPGAAFHYVPGTVHRVTALEDTLILEVSTPHLDDVVRLEDRYGRAGT